VGPSGSGKTTLLRLLNMSLRPTRGAVTIQGLESASLPRSAISRLRRQIGFIFQTPQLLPHLSAFDNVALPLRLLERPEGQIRTDVIEMLRWMGLSGKLISMPQDLSDGERQRVAIARAVIARPKLLLADEPSTHLDLNQTERVVLVLRELNRLGSTVIVATQNAAQIKYLPAPVLKLTDGFLEVIH
jgi:cell division transport system ATP-binding protein